MDLDGLIWFGLIINLGLCFLVAIIAEKKGRLPSLWFVMAFVFSALIALIVLLIMGDSETKRIERLREEKVIKDLIEAGFVGTADELAREAKSRVLSTAGVSNVTQHDGGQPIKDELKPPHRDGLSRALAIGLMLVLVVLFLVSFFDQTLFLG